MLKGCLVDLIPYGTAYDDLSYQWAKSESVFWASSGERVISSRAQARRWLDEFRAEAHGPGAGMNFGLRTKDGVLIGDMGINYINPHSRAANLGAMIGEPEYWGGGFGSDGLLLVQFCFDWLDMRRVHLETTGINARVIRQMEKVGFTLEARRRAMHLMDGQWQDGLHFGLLREDWPGREVLVERLGLRQRAVERYGGNTP